MESEKKRKKKKEMNHQRFFKNILLLPDAKTTEREMASEQLFFPVISAEIIRNVGVTEPGLLSPARVATSAVCLRRGTARLPQEQI